MLALQEDPPLPDALEEPASHPWDHSGFRRSHSLFALSAASRGKPSAASRHLELQHLSHPARAGAPPTDSESRGQPGRQAVTDPGLFSKPSIPKEQPIDGRVQMWVSRAGPCAIPRHDEQARARSASAEILSWRHPSHHRTRDHRANAVWTYPDWRPNGKLYAPGTGARRLPLSHFASKPGSFRRPGAETYYTRSVHRSFLVTLPGHLQIQQDLTYRHPTDLLGGPTELSSEHEACLC